jgi:glycosyltransferase involved in cell wall biosynthesis
MRIAHTEASLGWGGQEIRILSESKGLIGRGHEVVLLCPPQARIYAEAPAWQVPVVGVPISKKSLTGVRSLISWFKGNRCDVLSTHSSTDSWLSAFALLLMGRPFPIVRTRHISAPVPRNPFSRWLYTRATAHIVTTGELLKKELVERNGYPAERIESVPTGIDPRRFRPGDRGEARRRLGLPQDTTIVGIVATLRSWKGHPSSSRAGFPDGHPGHRRRRSERGARGAGAGRQRPRVRFAGNQATWRRGCRRSMSCLPS